MISLINGNNLSDVFLKDKPDEYNCNTYRMYFEGALLAV